MDMAATDRRTLPTVVGEQRRFWFAQSIRSKLVIGIVAIVLSLVCSLTIVTVRNTTAILNDELHSRMTQMLMQSTVAIERFLQVQQANLGLWVSEPLVNSVARDPALAPVFLPGLRSYFEDYVRFAPWIENIFLVVDDAVLYAHWQPAKWSEGDYKALLRLPVDQLKVLVLEPTNRAVASWEVSRAADGYSGPVPRNGVAAIRRALRADGEESANATIIVLLHLQVIQAAELASLRPSANGFLALVGRPANRPDQLWAPTPAGMVTQGGGAVTLQDPRFVAEAWLDFDGAAEDGLLSSSAPREYYSIILDHASVAGTPFSIVAAASRHDLRQPIVALLEFAVGLGAIALLLGVGAALLLSRQLTAPLGRLTASMLEIAGGKLRTPLPDASGTTDIDRMTEALAVFRDTAIEVEENNLREAATARQRLVDAVESISEGFAFFDAEDRLELCNSRYRDFSHDPAGKRIRVGMTFEEIARSTIEVGAVSGDPEAYVAQRVAQHRCPGEPTLRQFADGRWVQTSERVTSGGGIVSVYTDLTELKESEQRAAAANLLLTESLRYGQRIQRAVLPDPKALSELTSDHFLIWEPRDIVGGDFFWSHRLQDGYVIIVGDCTGHGAPGAFLTLIACSIVDRLLESGMGPDPGQLLGELHRRFQKVLGQDRPDAATDDGADVGVCVIDHAHNKLLFSGAHMSLLSARNGEVMEIKGSRSGVGYAHSAAETVYSSVDIDLAHQASFYLATDGFTDQVGGPKRQMFGKRRLLQQLAMVQSQAMVGQARALTEVHASYRGGNSKRDDVTVLGFCP